MSRSEDFETETIRWKSIWLGERLRLQVGTELTYSEDDGPGIRFQILPELKFSDEQREQVFSWLEEHSSCPNKHDECRLCMAQAGVSLGFYEVTFLRVAE